MNKPQIDPVLQDMLHSSVGNYVVPGLSSFLVGGEKHGTVRMFHMDREQMEHITPHSHRYNFTCLVLHGFVRQQVWHEHAEGDAYAAVQLNYLDEMGNYERERGIHTAPYKMTEYEYGPGEWYSMLYDKIHSIKFTRDTVVLFFQGPIVTNTSVILEPIVDGIHLQTMKVEPWMFQK